MQDVLDLLRDSPLDTSFVLRLGEIPAPLLHLFACDCAERVFRFPRALGGFPELPLRQLLQAKRAWIDRQVSTERLQEHLDATMLLASEPTDAVWAILRASSLDPMQAALQASQKAAWSCFERIFDEELAQTEQRFRSNSVIAPLFGDAPVGAALRFLGEAIFSPRRAAERVLTGVRNEMVEVVDDFQLSFASRKQEAAWQRAHLIEILEDYQAKRARLLGLLYQRALEKDDTIRRLRGLLEAPLFGG